MWLGFYSWQSVTETLRGWGAVPTLYAPLWHIPRLEGKSMVVLRGALGHWWESASRSSWFRKSGSLTYKAAGGTCACFLLAREGHATGQTTRKEATAAGRQGVLRVQTG